MCFFKWCDNSDTSPHYFTKNNFMVLKSSIFLRAQILRKKVYINFSILKDKLRAYKVIALILRIL